MDPSTEAAPRHVPAVLAVALVAISSAAVLVRAIDDASPVAIAFWRSLLVAVLLAPAVRRVSPAEAARIALAGACLAAHFVSWFASLGHISVMRSTVLVCLGPLWAGLIEWGVLGRSPGRPFFLGLGVGLGGIALLTGAPGAATLVGDLLALLGGVLGALYFVLGRSVRVRVGIGTYAALACAAAALSLLPVAWAWGEPLAGFHTRTWLLVLALALGPQLLGHNGLNYALRWYSAATVSAVTLLEPAGATALAAIFLGELPTPLAVLGAVISLAGVALATRR